jgi:hypothetical protein
MSLFKRHIGRRVAGVGVGVALLVLGLEAPAFAADPTIASFSPDTGGQGCVVVITGTNFKNPTVTEVDFSKAGDAFGNPTNVATFTIQSDTEIWADVPAATVTGQIAVKNASNKVASTGAFTAAATTTDAKKCAPTITSFKPGCGSADDVVTITGTNLLKNSGAGGDVAFAPNPPGVPATPTVPASPTSTQLTVVVPSGVGDGPLMVTTGADSDPTVALVQPSSAFSATPFTTPPPDCVPVGPVTHARSISLSLRKHLVARGKVSVGDGFTDCAASVPVKIQRRRAGGWRTVGSTTTTSTGAYSKRIRDRAGKYRAKAPKVSLGTPVTDICSGDTSPVRRNT